MPLKYVTQTLQESLHLTKREAGETSWHSDFSLPVVNSGHTTDNWLLKSNWLPRKNSKEVSRWSQISIVL
jgi:hypothetical protein